MAQSQFKGSVIRLDHAIVPTMTEEEMQEVYNWVDEIPLSRPKKNIARDFSDCGKSHIFTEKASEISFLYQLIPNLFVFEQCS